VSVGASGAVMGLAGAAMGFVYRPTASITAAIRKQILERAWGFAGMTLLYGFKPGIDQAAHFGGFAGGLICGLILSQPLSNPWDRRWIRSSLVASVGLLAVTLAVAAPPKVVVAEKVWLQISDDESAALKDYHSLFDELDAGKITLPDFATALQSKVLRRWQEGRARFEVLLALPYGNKPLIEKYRDYFQLREESTALQIKSIQQNNENLKREAAAKSQAADELSEEISAMSADLNRATSDTP